MSIQRAQQRAHNQHHGSIEWYTPPDLLAKIRAFYGGEYFDPCPASAGKVHDSGLMVPWHGRAFVNPPYGAMIRPWIRKAMSEPVSEIILLVPAYTDTQWFAPLTAHTICFISGRLCFRRPDGTTGRAPHPSALVYRGRRWRLFADLFADLGPILRTYAPKRDPQPRLLEVGA